MEPEDIPRTAVTTLLGLFEFAKTPFGLRNAAQSFQWFMDRILYGLSFEYAYNNDIFFLLAHLQNHMSKTSKLILNGWNHMA